MAPPFKEAEFDIMYGEGISRSGDLLDVGVTAGIIDKSGSWYSYNGERIGQGRENVKKFFQDNPVAMFLKIVEVKLSYLVTGHFHLLEAESSYPGQCPSCWDVGRYFFPFFSYFQQNNPRFVIPFTRGFDYTIVM